MRPDTSGSNPDRSSVEAFDVNKYLRKSAEKDPSVSCVGVNGSITGYRADLLLADDIEDPKTVHTAGARETLLHRSKEFSSVCVGRIIYLGTPHSIDSVYNTLPGRGFTVRIWPGRYPTPEQMKWYGEHLAPSIAEKLRKDPSLATGGGIAGDQGKPTDTRIDEDILRRKELEIGTPDFQLQFMLNTSMADSERYPLRTERLVYDRLDGNLYPSVLSRDPRETGLRKFDVAGHSFMMAGRMDVPTTDISGNQTLTPFMELQDRIIYIDPAGGGTISKDETAFVDLGILNSNLFLVNAGGVPGGYESEKLEQLAQIVAEANPNRIVIEKNYGNGAFKEIFLPILRKYWQGEVRDHTVSGQKEKRIAGILGPIMGRGALCVTQQALDSDAKYLARYPADVRRTYSLFFQMSKMTLDKDSLAHDDRLDALAGAAAQFVHLLVVDQETASRKAYEAQLVEFFKNPTNKPNYNPPRRGSLFNKYLR